MNRGIGIEQLPVEIAEPLRRFVMGRRLAALLRALAISVLVMLLWVLVWGIVDRFMPLPVLMRVVLFVGLGVVIGCVLFEPLTAILHWRIDWLTAAKQFERRDPRFSQALVTVVSQMLSTPQNRGSAELTAAIKAAVVANLKSPSQKLRADLTSAVRAWSVATVGLILFVGLIYWPWLDLPTLVLRQISPFAPAQAVTTTRIMLQPGAVEVLQGQDVQIFAKVENPGRDGVILFTTTDGRNWSSTGMSRDAEGIYAKTLTALSRDARYEVRSGDASVGPFSIRVLHHPVVRSLHVQFDYPSHVGREPLTVLYSSGEIEAPVGTRARLVVQASEPLRSAWFIVNGKRSEAGLTRDRNSRQLELTITNDTQVSLEMVSEYGVSGNGGAPVMIRAIPDRAPAARLLVPAGFTLLSSRGSVEVPYEVIDDYAIASLEARVEVDGEEVGRLPLKLESDPHRQEGTLRLNLSDWDVRLGQLVTVILFASDMGSQIASSAPWRVLVSPETVLPEQRRRVAELHEATQLGPSIVSELNGARMDLGRFQGDAVGGRQPAVRLAIAAERSTLLIRSLLRAATGLADEPSVRTFWSIVDATQALSARLEQVSIQSSIEPTEVIRTRLDEFYESAVQIDRAVQTLWQGHCAELILSQRRALVAVREIARADLSPLREAIEAQTQDLGLEPRMLDLDEPLRTRVAAMRGLLQSFPPPDLIEAARRWAASENPAAWAFAQQLSLAAQVESVRTDADLIRVRDLQLASRAARAIERLGGTPLPGSSPTSREALLNALELLVREHEMRRGGPSNPLGPAFQDQADAARRAMSIWAGETNAAVTLLPATQPIIAVFPSTQPSVSDTRDQALTIIRQMQQVLVEMPQLLAEVEQAGSAVRAARNRLSDASRDAEAARLEDEPAALRTVGAAQEIVNENIDLLTDTAQAIDFNQPMVFARQLRAFLPDTAGAVTTIEQSFAVSLTALHRAIDEQNTDEIDRLISETRRSIALVQQSLHEARQTLLARDPALSARSFAAATRPTTQSTMTYNILQRSWEETIRRLSESQLGVPFQQQTLLSPSQIATSRQLGADTAPASADVPRRMLLRPWRPDDLTATLRDSDPPQYRESLDAYFRVLGASESQSTP